MQYKVTPIRSYNEYTKVAENEAVAAAELLFDYVEHNEGEEVDRCGVIENSLNNWLNNKEDLAMSPLFNGCSKFQLDIEDIEVTNDSLIEAVNKYIVCLIRNRYNLWNYPHDSVTAFHATQNYMNILKEQPLRLRPKKISYESLDNGFQYEEEDFLVRHVTDMVGNDVSCGLVRAGRTLQANGDAAYVANPSVILGVYKFLSDVGVIQEEDNCYYSTQSAGIFFKHYFCPPNVLSTSVEDPHELDIVRDKDSINMDPEDLSGGSVTVRTADDGMVTELVYSAPSSGWWWSDERTVFTQTYDINDMDLSITSYVYSTLVHGFHEVLARLDKQTADELCEPLFNEINNTLRVGNPIISRELMLKYDDLLPTGFEDTRHLDYVVVGMLAADLASALLFRPLLVLNTKASIGSSFIPRQVITELDDSLTKKLNNCGTLNKQLKMLEREIQRVQYSYLQGYIMPEYKYELILSEYYYHDAAREALSEVLHSAKWLAAEDVVNGYYDDNMKAVISLSRQKSFRQKKGLGDILTDSLKIKNAAKHILPKSDTWIVSLETEDILTASVNRNSWDSCHAGSYANTPVMLAANTLTFVLYQKSSEDLYSHGVAIDNKKVRAYGHYVWHDNGSASLIIEQSYPHDSKILEDIVPTILGEIGEVYTKEVEDIEYDMSMINDGEEVVTGYVDLFETEGARSIGDFTIAAEDIVAYPSPNFMDGDTDFCNYYGVEYGDFGNLDIFYRT